MGKARTELVLAYVGGLGLSAIRVMIEKTGETPCWLTCETEPAIVGTDGPRVIFDTLWFSKASHAELVLAQCQAGLINRPAAAVRDEVINIAGMLGADWQTAAQIIESAEKAVDEIERHVKVWNQVGGLSAFNKAYKKYRMKCIDAAVSAVTYSMYLHSFKLKVAALIGRNVAGGADKFAGFSAIVPSLISDIGEAMSSLPVLRNTSAPYADRLNYEPPHHTRRDVHHMRRLKV